jgi:hypothetical protein
MAAWRGEALKEGVWLEEMLGAQTTEIDSITQIGLSDSGFIGGEHLA